ncbi:MAG: alginate export family protein [Myxococcota bacterium]
MIVLLWMVFSSGDPVQCKPTPIQSVRYFEDYRDWSRTECHRGTLAELKRLMISENSSSFVSVGGQARLRWERFTRESFGRIPTDDDGQLLYRSALHADLHLSAQWRVFAQLRSAGIAGRESGPRPFDEDRLDMHQLFLERRLRFADGALTLRLGRQESARDFRLVSTRDWPNVRLAFDGALISWERDEWVIDGYGALSVGADDGVFDDFASERTRLVYGLHATLRDEANSGTTFTLFYTGHTDSSPSGLRAVDREQRQSAGTDASVDLGAVDSAVELVLQVGRSDGREIFAWFWALDAGVEGEWRQLGMRWESSFEAGSGDGDLGDGKLGTFNAFFPKNRYFAATGLVGAFSNALHVRNSAILTFKSLSLVGELEQFWRTSLQDAVFAPGGFPTLVALDSRERFIGHQIDARLSITLSRNLDAMIRYAHFFRGAHAKDAGVNGNTAFAATQLRFRF